jgi:hypothetical protein
VTVLAPCSVYASPRWLEVQMAGGRAPTRLLTASRAGSPRGWLPIHDRLPTRNPRYALASLCRGFPHIPASASYVGLVSGYQTEVATLAGEDVLAELFEDALRSGPDQPLIVPYATGRLARALAHIAPDAPCVLEAADAWLLNPFPTVDAWLAAQSGDLRRQVMRDERSFARAGLEDAIVPLGGHVQPFAELVSQHARRHGLDEPVAMLVGLLSAIARAFGDDAVLFTAFQGGKLVSAQLGLVHGDHIFMRMAGDDQDVVGGSAAQFVLTFYRPLRFCAERGLAGVHLGLAIDRTKRSRGATIEPLWTIVLGALPAPVDARSLLEARLGDIADGDPGTAATLRDRLA